MAILNGKKKANKKDKTEKNTVEKVEQTFKQTNEPAVTETEKVKVGFEKLEDLDREIKKTEENFHKLTPLVQKERDEGKRFGEHSLIQSKLIRKLDKLREEKATITSELIVRSEPLTDPVKAVKEKYKYTREYQHSMYLLQTAAKKFRELQGILGEFIALTPVHRQVIPTYLQTLQAAEFNCLHVLEYTRPRNAETYNRELKEAQELVDKLRQEAEEKERLKKIYVS